MSYPATVLALNPLAYWRLGEASGTNAADATGNGNTGTYINTPMLGVTGALVADPNTAVTFVAASSQRVSVAASASLDATTAVTVAAWVRISSTTADAAIFAHRGVFGSGITGYELYVQNANGKPSLFLGDGTNFTVTPLGANSIRDGNWHFVAGVRSGNSASIYVDGVQVYTNATVASAIGSMTPGSPIVSSIADWTSTNGNANFFPGTIDEVAIWNVALTSSQIFGLYVAGVSVGPAVTEALGVLV